jgi:hypothetical protein
MPFDQVMHKFKHGSLHSGSKSGKKVTNRKQAIAIMMSEKKKAESGNKEYQPKKKKKGTIDAGPTKNFMKKFESTK